MTPEDLLEILQQPGFLPKLWTVEISLPNQEDKFSTREICLGGQEKHSQTIRILNGLSTSPIPWHSSPSLYHVIDTVTTSSSQAKAQHLHSNGAKKVLLANRAVEGSVPRFRPNITNNHKRKYQVQHLVFTHEVCSPLALRAMMDRIFGFNGGDVLRQAISVVDLMSKSITFHSALPNGLVQIADARR